MHNESRAIPPALAMPILDELQALLIDLESNQAAFLAMFKKKSVVMKNPTPIELVRLIDEELKLTRITQDCLNRRTSILSQVGKLGLNVNSLSEVIQVIAGAKRNRLLGDINRIEDGSQRIRKESWVHWIIAHRTQNLYTELLEIIAQCGEKPATYSPEDKQCSQGGALLDTSA